VHSHTSYHLAGEVVARSGAVAVAALALAPLAALAGRRRWSAFVLGGTALLLALELLPFLFPRFSDLVSLSQSRRAAGFLPFAIAFAGGLGVLPRVIALPVALAGGIVLQLVWPGDFSLRLAHGGPALVAWWAFFGCLAGLVYAALRPGDRTRSSALAAALFVLPVAIHGFAHWDAARAADPLALTPGVVHVLPKGAVVYADLETSYRLSAYAPVYVANGPPTHVADTTANDPYGRRDDLRRFLRGARAIPVKYGAQYLVLRRGEWRRGTGTLVYRDARFHVYRLR
jgi:hypothetical protein